MFLNLPFYNPKKIEGYEMYSEDVNTTIKYLENVNDYELQKHPCIGDRYMLLKNGIKILHVFSSLKYKVFSPSVLLKISEEKILQNAAIGSSAENAYKGPETDRRGFISWLSFGWLAYLGVTGGFFTMIVRFLFPNVLFEPPQTFKIGYPDDFSKNSVDIKYKKQFNAWIVRDEESIFALSTVCTHLGCTPNWLPVESKFKCRCHGSGFRMTGIHFEGPAPRPLERFKIGLANDGQILVDKTKSFKWERVYQQGIFLLDAPFGSKVLVRVPLEKKRWRFQF